MSAAATFWAWKQQVTSTQKLALLALANCHNDATGQCNPSIAYIAGTTGLNRKTVLKALHEIESAGLIIADKGNGFGNSYTLNTSPKNGTGTEIGTSPKNGTGTSPKIGTEPVPKLVHESKKNLKDESKSIGRGTRLPADWTLPEDWKAIAKTIRPEWPDHHVQRVSDGFRDYWIAKTGSGASKADWLATWRNWCRNDKSPVYGPASTPQSPTPPKRKPMPMPGPRTPKPEGMDFNV